MQRSIEKHQIVLEVVLNFSKSRVQRHLLGTRVFRKLPNSRTLSLLDFIEMLSEFGVIMAQFAEFRQISERCWKVSPIQPIFWYFQLWRYFFQRRNWGTIWKKRKEISSGITEKRARNTSEIFIFPRKIIMKIQLFPNAYTWESAARQSSQLRGHCTTKTSESEDWHLLICNS